MPKLLNEVEDIDLFIHDSEHSTPCMLFEFELAWEHLADGGVLIADDIHWNDAFEEFVSTRIPDGNWGRVSRSVGYAVKP